MGETGYPPGVYGCWWVNPEAHGSMLWAESRDDLIRELTKNYRVIPDAFSYLLFIHCMCDAETFIRTEDDVPRRDLACHQCGRTLIKYERAVEVSA